jgi:hypothetical protein
MHAQALFLTFFAHQNSARENLSPQGNAGSNPGGVRLGLPTGINPEIDHLTDS